MQFYYMINQEQRLRYRQFGLLKWKQKQYDLIPQSILNKHAKQGSYQVEHIRGVSSGTQNLGVLPVEVNQKKI